MPKLPSMLRNTFVAAFAIYFLFSPVTVQATLDEENMASMIRNKIYASGEISETEFYVKFKDTANAGDMGSLNAKLKADVKSPEKINKLFGGKLQLVHTESKEDMEILMHDYAVNTNVEWVETVKLGKFHQPVWTDGADRDASDDYDPSRHWYFENTNLPELWNDQDCANSGTLCGGDSDVVVAVLDSGVAFENYVSSYEYFNDTTLPQFRTMPQLSGIHLWTNALEDGDGGDEDGNYYCDDEHGIDAEIEYENWLTGDFTGTADWQTKCDAGNTDIRKEGHPNDDLGHGTYVTGIIAGLVNDTTAVGAVSGAHNVSIMPVKVGTPGGYIRSDVLEAGVVYAVDEGAHIINTSLGFDTDSDHLIQAAVEYAYAHNVLIVASSGNGSGDGIDYPAAFASTYSNVLAVGSVNADNSRSSYSDYGPALSLVAPVGQGSSQGNATWQQTFNNSVLDNCYVMPWSYQCTNPTYTSQSTCEANSETWYAAPEGICSVNRCNNYTEAMCTGAGGTWTAANYLHETYTSEKYWIGTSFAAPQVSAAAAIIKSKKSNASALEMRNYLRSTAIDIGATGRDDLTGSGLLNVNDIWNNLWTNWVSPIGGTSSSIAMATFSSRLYQSIRGTDNRIYTRYTTDGTTWSSWVYPLGATSAKIMMETFNSRLYQAIRGTDNHIYTRNTTDGDTWSSWVYPVGATSSAVVMEVFNSRLYQAIRGTDNNIYTRYTTDGDTWSSWSLALGATSSNVTMAVYNSRLYQAIRGTDNHVYTRYTTDGNTWTGWVSPIGSTNSNVTMELFDSKLYQAIRGTDNHIYTRYTADGDTWSSWNYSAGSTSSDVTMAVINNRLYEAIRGTENYIYTRYSEDGTTWSNWVYPIGATAGSANMMVFGTSLYQAIRGTDNHIYTRTLL